MDERQRIARLYRRVGFGLAPGELDTFVALGFDATVDRLLDPGAHGVAAVADGWDDDALRTEGDRGVAEGFMTTWLDRMRSTPRPLVEWMAWYWHGHFVAGLDKVNVPLAMANQIRLFLAAGLGPFPALVRAVTVDPAMLVYLDGAKSKAGAPNENYGRELQELFTLGYGNYTEDDVTAAAVALTGWTVDRPDATASFVARRHDDRPQRVQGTGGVHDVDTVVAAVTAPAGCATFVADRLARAITGDTVAGAAGAFAAAGLAISALVRPLLEADPDGRSRLVLAPVPWLVSIQKATAATVQAGRRLALLRAAGQVPGLPPNVGGWPSGTAWFNSSAVVARFELAQLVAAAAPDDNPAVAAATAREWDALADDLACPGGFTPATLAALADAAAGRPALALALASPDLVVA